MIQLYRGTHNNSIIMGDNGATPLWVAEDGSWGTSPVTIFDCHAWSASDFDDLDAASDGDKVKTAEMITDEVNAKQDIELRFFLDLVRERSASLGVRMFQLTEEGMEELT